MVLKLFSGNPSGPAKALCTALSDIALFISLVDFAFVTVLSVDLDLGPEERERW